MAQGYANCFIANNDVLVTPLTVGLMASALTPKQRSRSSTASSHTAKKTKHGNSAAVSGGAAAISVAAAASSAVDVVVPVTRRGAGGCGGRITSVL